MWQIVLMAIRVCIVKVGALLVFSTFLTSQALADELIIDKFMTKLKEQTLADLDSQANRALELRDCAHNPSCELADDIIKKYYEYRIYVGLLEYRDLKNRLKQLGQAYIVHRGLRLHFTLRNQQGKDEWRLIQFFHQNDNKQILENIHQLKISQDTREFNQAHYQHIKGQRSHYASAVAEFLSTYPFFINIQEQILDRTTLAKAIENTGRQVERTLNHVEGLEGHDRMELLGFVDSVEKVVEAFSEDENRIMANYIESLNRQTRVWGRILSILTNWKTLAIATCHVSTFAVASVPHPVVQLVRSGVSALCISTGVSLSLTYFGESTRDFLRQMQYMRTGIYSGEVFEQYLRSYMVTTVMAFLYVVPALPSLKGRIDDMRSLAAISQRAYRLNRLSFNPRKLRNFDPRNFNSEVKLLGKRYATYYGEELAISSLLMAGGRYVANLQTIERAIVVVLKKAMERERAIFSYGDVLKLI